MVHDDDKKSLREIANVLVEKIGERPAVRESVTRLLTLVYEKGQLRGTQASLQSQVEVLRAERDALFGERPSDASSDAVTTEKG